MTIQSAAFEKASTVTFNELLVVSPDVKDHEMLTENVSGPTDILQLNPEHDALSQVVKKLEQNPGTVQKLHILAHGAPGEIRLGDTMLDTDALHSYGRALNRIKGALADEAEIALWSCSVAWMDEGKRFVELLSQRTGARVFASDQPVGASTLGGTWEIGTTSPFSKASELAYPHSLTPYTGTFTFTSALTAGAYNSAPATTNAEYTVGDYTLVVDGLTQGTGHTSGGTAASNGAETQVTLYFDSGTTFDVNSIDLSNSNIPFFTPSITYRIESDKGDSTTFTLNDGSKKTVDLSSFQSGISSLTFTVDGGGNLVYLQFDNLNIANLTANAAPELGGTPSDDTVTEDVATAIDLSDYTISDADNDSPLTITLAVDRGTIASVDGSVTIGGVTITNSGTASMTLEGTAAALETYLDDTSHITFTTDQDDTATAILTATPNDGTSNGTPDTVQITIDPVEDAPTISGLTDRAATEDIASSLNLSGVTIADVDTTGNITVTITATDTDAVLGAVDGSGAGASGVTETASGNNVVTLVGTATDITTYLSNAAAITYTSSQDTESNDTISIQADDGVSTPNAASTATIVMTAVNDLPAGTDNTLSTDDITSRTLTAADFGFSDVDTGDTLSSVRIDTLTLTSGTFQLSSTNVAATDVITVADINAGNLVYTPAASTTGNSQLAFTFSVHDGTGFDASPNNFAIDVTSANTAPDLGGAPADDTVTEDLATAIDLSDYTISDADGDSPITLTLAVDRGTIASVTGNGSFDSVTITNSGTTSMTLQGSSAALNTFLDNTSRITFTTDANDTTTATLTVTPNDGTVNGTADTVSISINAINDLPSAITPATNPVTTEDIATAIDLSTLDFTDIDSDGLRIILTADAGILTAADAGSVTVSGSGTDRLQLNGTFDDIEAYLSDTSRVSYTGAENANGTNATTITVRANDGDGSGNYVVGTFQLDVTAVNDAPTSADNTITLDEDTSYTFQAADFNFADVDTGDTLSSVRIDSLNLAADDRLQLSGIDITNGQVIAVADIANLVYTPAADAFGAALSSFTFTVHDGTAFAAATSTLTFDVTDVEEIVTPPSNSAPQNLSISSTSVAENTPGAVVGNLSVSDPDGDPVTLSVSNNSFEITGTTLKLKDGVSLDYEANSSVYVSVTATDSNGASLHRSFTISVIDEDETGGSGSDGGGSGQDDTLSGSDADDTINGSAGDDTISGNDGKDNLSGGAGNDTIDGGNDDDSINGGDGADNIIGGLGQDTLLGGDGDDTIDAGSGDDIIWAGAEDNGADIMMGDAGNDMLGSGNGNDNVDAGEGNDTVFGAHGNDIISGDSGNDLIFNGAGDDTVDGGSGDDQLWASSGNDVLTGGSGADTFTFGSDHGSDTITDFAVGEDTLDLQFAGTGLSSLTDLANNATENTIDGQTGLSIDLGNGETLFLIGLTADDISLMNVTF